MTNGEPTTKALMRMSSAMDAVGRSGNAFMRIITRLAAMYA